MKKFKKIYFLFLIVIFVQPYYAQQEDKSLLTIDRIFNSMDFMGERFGPARFIENGKYYTTLESSKDVPGGRDRKSVV
jgi:dipeptidyl-peptidase 4